jgi:hypothetical protein
VKGASLLFWHIALGLSAPISVLNVVLSAWQVDLISVSKSVFPLLLAMIVYAFRGLRKALPPLPLAEFTITLRLDIDTTMVETLTYLL